MADKVAQPSGIMIRQKGTVGAAYPKITGFNFDLSLRLLRAKGCSKHG
jgi:hypothetical protein